MSTIRIACLGDIMCGDSFYNIGSGVASSLAKHGRDFLRPDIAQVLREHDVVIGNVECVLSNKGRDGRLLRSIHMRGDSRTADLLADWNLTVANLANNHIFEHGYEAAQDTVDNLVRTGVRVIGAGEASRFRKGLHVERLSRRGQTLAFIGMCLRREKYAYNGGAELEQVIDAVEVLGKSGIFVCVSVHWGDEFMDCPSVEQTRAAGSLIRAGARMVIGHHPHVVQGLSLHNGSIVAYSLGNFIFDACEPDCRWSVILSVEVADGIVAGWRCLPVLNDSEHRPALAANPGRTALIDEFMRRCSLLHDNPYDENYQSRYRAEFKSRDALARRKLRTHLCKCLPHIDRTYWPQILLRPLQRRLGVW